MNRRKMSPLLVAVVFALGGAGDAAAQTLYKLIDKNGKVTYSEKAPKDYDGKVIPMTIDPNANTATLPKLPPPEKAEPESREAASSKEGRAAKSSGDRVKDARKRLEDARRAYQNAVDNPSAEDVSRVGTKSGGARPVFSENYAARLTALEAAVKQAEEELKRAEGG